MCHFSKEKDDCVQITVSIYWPLPKGQECKNNQDTHPELEKLTVQCLKSH